MIDREKYIILYDSCDKFYIENDTIVLKPEPGYERYLAFEDSDGMEVW
jgi:hypothetical protein